jgi:hypothetical protein
MMLSQYTAALNPLIETRLSRRLLQETVLRIAALMLCNIQQCERVGQLRMQTVSDTEDEESVPNNGKNASSSSS